MPLTPRILVVDDDPVAIQSLYEALEGLGDLLFATSGADALTVVAETPADLILLDALMPGMDGFETCQALRRDHPDIPILFVTGARDIANEIRALEVGAMDFISKPITPPVVRARVSLHLKLQAHNAERQRAAAELAAREEELRKLVNGLPIAVAISTLGANAKITFLNEQAIRTFGYTLDDIPTVADWTRKAYPDAQYRQAVFDRWDEAVRRAIEEQGRVESMEFRVTGKDGVVHDTLLNAIVLEDRLVVGLIDISERKRAEAELRSVREQLEKTAYELTENIPVGTYTAVLPPGATMAHLSFVSKRFLELIGGLDRDEVVSDLRKSFACVHPDDYDDWVKRNVEAFTRKLPFFGQCRIIVNGAVRWISAEAIPRDLPDGSTVWEGVLIDVTDRVLASEAVKQANAALQAANEELNRLATTDALTGAWNRRRLEEAVATEIARLERYGYRLSLMVIDIDHFKKINDVYGHAAGDQVLAGLAAVVRSNLRSTDSLTRLGGEEFVVLTPNESLSRAARLAKRLRETIARTAFPTVDKITVSIGVAECLPGERWEQWFARADAALYRAKAGGRNQIQTAPETPQRTGRDETAAMSFVQFNWHQAYECGHPLIDQQHRALFAEANGLLAAALSERPADEIARLIDTLIRDVVQHFHDEAAIITAAGYPGAAEHAACHRSLVDQAGVLVSRFQAGTLNIGELFQFLAHDVVILHMLRSDREYLPYLGQR